VAGKGTALLCEKVAEGTAAAVFTARKLTTDHRLARHPTGW